MASRVEHVGIAVSDLEAGIRLYRDLLGLELERIEEVPGEAVRVAFLRCGGEGAGHVELLCPTGDGAIEVLAGVDAGERVQLGSAVAASLVTRSAPEATPSVIILSIPGSTTGLRPERRRSA